MHCHADDKEKIFLAFADDFSELEGPVEPLHRDKVDLLILSGQIMDKNDVPGLDKAMKESISERMYEFRIADIFDDDATPAENLAL